MSLVLTEQLYAISEIAIQEDVPGQEPHGIDNQKEITQDNLKCGVVSVLPVPTQRRKRSKRRNQKNAWCRRRKLKKRDKSPIPDWKLEQDEEATVPDLRKRLPFTHCKIVLSFEDDEEQVKKGWVKEDKQFIFNDLITFREKKKFARCIWEPVSPRPRRSSKSKASKVKNPAPENTLHKEYQQPFPPHGIQAEETKSAGVIEEASPASKSEQSEETKGPDQIGKCKLSSPINPPLSKDEAKAVTANFWPIYKCPYCHATFSHSRASINHLRLHRTGLKTVAEHQESCENSEGQTPNLILQNPNDKDVRAAKTNYKRRFNCQKCSYSSVTSDQLRLHMEAHNQIGKPFKCSVCPCYFRRITGLRLHEKYIHKGYRRRGGKLLRRFDTVGGTTTTRFSKNKDSSIAHLNQHSMTHTGIKPHKCSLCPKAFFNRRNLHRHFITHNGIKPHKCSLCPKAFFHRHDLNRHLLSHTGVKSHKCSLCPKAFFDRSNRRRHFITHSGIKPHKCSLCPKAFFHRHDLNRHLLSHTGVKPHKCSLCPKAFFDRSNLRRHFITHSGIKPHKCSLCPKAYFDRSNLHRHLKTHNEINSHKCSLCPKAYFDRSNLNGHLMTHSGIKPHKCSVCPKAFFHRSNLRRHFMTHSGIKPHKCSQCPKAFFHRHALNRHLLSHIGIKPHKCNLCPKAYFRKADLDAHLMTHGEPIPQHSLEANSN